MTAWKAERECSIGSPSRNANMTIAHTAKIGVWVPSLIADHSWCAGIPPSLEKLHSILHDPAHSFDHSIPLICPLLSNVA